MDEPVRKISADDIKSRYNWGRALPALGTMGVDFEERVDYRRLHRYRLSRVRQATILRRQPDLCSCGNHPKTARLCWCASAQTFLPVGALRSTQAFLMRSRSS